MIDLDAKFSDGFGLKEGLRFIMGEGGANLRGLLKGEALTIGDLVFRNIVRKQVRENAPILLYIALPLLTPCRSSARRGGSALRSQGRSPCCYPSPRR